MSFVDVLVAVFTLGLVIVFHEFGHYIAAVRSGMKVDRFSVFGIGPAIVKLGTWRGTEFVIGAIPFGAYVLIRGMEPEDVDADAPPREPGSDSANFRDKPLAARAAALAGGPIANYVLAILIFVGVFAVAGMQGPPRSIEVRGFTEDSAAQAAGLEVGDELVRIGDTVIDPTQKGRDVTTLSNSLRGQTAPIEVLRDGERMTLEMAFPDREGPMGMWFQGDAPRVPVPFTTALVEGAKFPFVLSAQQLEGLWQLVTGQLDADLGGPVELGFQLARSSSEGAVSLFFMAGLISTLLGLFNLLPIPALDGGRLVFLMYEAVARRRASAKVEELVHGYGMLVLLALLVVITVGDIRDRF